MSTAVAHFPDPGKRKVAKADLIPFEIGDEPFRMARPKQFDLAQIAMALESGIPLDDRRNLRTMLRYSAQMLRYVTLEPMDANGGLHGRELLESRLSDPDDALDLSFLLPILGGLMRGWFDRPTGSPPASTARRPAASRARGSAARTRSTRAKT